MTRRLAALALLMLCASTANADGGLVASRGTCEDGELRRYDAVDGFTATDCTTGGGAYDVFCCCSNGSWAACGGSGGGNSFETIDAPAGADPVADSSSDTLQVLANGTGTVPSGIEVTGDSAADTLSISLTDDCAHGEVLQFLTTPSRWNCASKGVDATDFDTSSELRGILTDETGTGAAMFGLTTSMADDMPCTGDQYIKRNTGDTAWECVGYAGGLVSADIDTSSELRAILTDEVGTGSLMFGLATTTTDDLSCSGSQVVRRNSGDTAFECVSAGTLGGETSSVLNRLTAAVNIDNDNTETTLYAYTIPANTLDADSELRLKILSEFFNNTAAGRGYTLKFKLGGSTVIEYTTGSAAFGSTATRRNFTLLVSVSQTGATNSQIVTVEHYATSTVGLFGTLTTGTGLTMSTAVNVGHWNSGALAVDMTSSQTLEVTVTLSAANTNLEWKTYAATLELLNP